MYHRALMSQAISNNEIGRVFSVLALFGALSNSLGAAAWQKLYNVTLDTLPGTYLIVVTILMLITIPTNLIMKKLASSHGNY